MFFWSPETIRFRVDAANYNQFEPQLARRLLPYFAANDHICDAGCGLGYLSLALAKAGYRVTAVDTSESALQVLRQNTAAQGLSTLTALQGDVFSLQPPQLYDGMVFCFFGKTDETLRAVKSQCRGKAALFKKAWHTHRFTVQQKSLARLPFQQTCCELDALGIPYQAETFLAETGQPFRTLEDAMQFFSIYDPAAPSEEAVKKRLVCGSFGEFSYYMPFCGPVGMIVLDSKNIPDFI